jgi:SAM-dependent methyltransferase
MTVDLMEMVTAYQRTAIVASACETGVADAIAGEGRTAGEVAKERSLDPRGAQALLGAMVGLGLAVCDGEAYRLSPQAAPLASAHPATVARVVAKEWFFYDAWRGLPQTVRDGHARIAPWEARLADKPETSLRFLHALDDLGAMFGSGLAEAAGIDGARTLLDAGGGSGVHAAHLVRRVPGLTATVLELAAVEPLVRELHPELRFRAGDLAAPRLGLPGDERFDAVLLANVLHDHPAETCARIVAQAAALLAPAGTLLVYEWLLDADRDGPPDVATFALMMMVENEGGAAYTEAEVRRWLIGAGLSEIEAHRPGGPIAVVRARPLTSEERT